MIKTMQDMYAEIRTKFHTVTLFEWIFYKCSDQTYAEKIPNTIFRRNYSIIIPLNEIISFPQKIAL